MSNNVNTDLYEKAGELIDLVNDTLDYVTGWSGLDRILETMRDELLIDLKNDLDRAYNVSYPALNGFYETSVMPLLKDEVQRELAEM